MTAAACSCKIGQGEACGHVVGLLYNLAKLKKDKCKALPEDIAKTSLPQTWHQLRGEKISGQVLQEIQLHGYKKRTVDTNSEKSAEKRPYIIQCVGPFHP